MRIASQHAYKDKDYSPRHDWPGETLVQWGSSGLVIGKKPYRTAFFEAFPDKSVSDAGGFIRGEGKTIADAEDNAFAKFLKESSCNHLWGREHYTNGGQLCRHCRAFRSGHIKPIVKLKEWRQPLTSGEGSLLEFYRQVGNDQGTDARYNRILQIRESLFGVTGQEIRSP